MSFSVQKSLKASFKSSWTILKLIVPIYILADLLFYYDLLSHITFIFKPLVTLLRLTQVALVIHQWTLSQSLRCGLGAKEWTFLAVFLGIAHAFCLLRQRS